jgi:hypothetical protein
LAFDGSRTTLRMPPIANQPPSEAKQRLARAALLVCGGVWLELSVLHPLQEAQSGSASVSLGMKGALVVPKYRLGALGYH